MESSGLRAAQWETQWYLGLESQWAGHLQASWPMSWRAEDLDWVASDWLTLWWESQYSNRWDVGWCNQFNAWQVGGHGSGHQLLSAITDRLTAEALGVQAAEALGSLRAQTEDLSPRYLMAMKQVLRKWGCWRCSETYKNRGHSLQTNLGLTLCLGLHRAW